MAIAIKIALAQLTLECPDNAGFPRDGLEHGTRIVVAPGPSISEPKRWKHVNFRRFSASIVDTDLDQDIFGRLLGVLHKHVEVAVLVENSRVEQLVLRLIAVPSSIGPDQLVIWVGGLRVLIEELHVRMRRRAVEIEVALLYVLAMIALLVG